MKNIIVLLLCSCCLLTGKSQIPGYLGKRFTLSYEQLAGPNYFNLIGLTDFSYLNSSVDEDNANWNYTGMLTIDYVINKSKSRGISVSPINQTMYFKDAITTPDINYPHTYNVSEYINSAKLTGFTTGVYVKYFKKQWIAPLGEYYKLELLYSSYKIKSFKNKTDVYSSTSSSPETYSSIGFAITHGVNRIFFDKLIVSFGVTMGYRLNFYNPFTDKYASTNNETLDNLAKLKNSAHYWHGQNLFFNLHTGVGFLLF